MFFLLGSRFFQQWLGETRQLGMHKSAVYGLHHVYKLTGHKLYAATLHHIFPQPPKKSPKKTLRRPRDACHKSHRNSTVCPIETVLYALFAWSYITFFHHWTTPHHSAMHSGDMCTLWRLTEDDSWLGDVVRSVLRHPAWISRCSFRATTIGIVEPTEICAGTMKMRGALTSSYYNKLFLWLRCIPMTGFRLQ